MSNESEKPKSFEDRALSHIPRELLEEMKRETSINVEGMSPLQAIMADKNRPLPPTGPTAPQQKQHISIAVNDKVIEVSKDPFEGSITMLLFLLATVWSKDPKIAKVLKAFNFSFYDANGDLLYPKQKKSKKK